MLGCVEVNYTVRQTAYDLRKFRGKATGRQAWTITALPGAARSRTMTALLTLVLREQVIGPILAGCRVPMRGRRPNAWTVIDCDYETQRLDMATLFYDLGITT